MEVFNVKKTIFIICLLSLLTVGAFAKGNFWQLGLGLTQIEDEYYGTFSFRPNLQLGKLGLGLSMTVNFNQDGLRLEDWQKDGEFDLAKSAARIVRFVSWGQLGDPIYIRAGELSNVYVANGLIVNGYRNLKSDEIKKDIRRLGLDVAGDIGIIGAHVMVNDALDPELFAVNPYVRPFYLVDPLPTFIKRTSVGVIYVKDNRPEYLMPYAYGLDVTIPLLSNLKFYGQTAELANKAKGYSIGARTDLGPLYLQGEYRIYEENFQPEIYNWAYEEFGTELVLANEKANGYMAETGFSLFNDGVYAQLRYENMMVADKQPIPTLTGRAVVGGNLFATITGRKGEVEASYSQYNFIKIDELANSRSKVEAKVSIELLYGVMGSYIYKVTFNPDKNNEPVKFQAFEVTLGGAF